MIALKTILKEIDPFAFEEALRMNATQKKQFAVKQDEDDRKNLDKKWDKLNTKLKNTDSTFTEPDCMINYSINITIFVYRSLQAVAAHSRLQRALHEDIRQRKIYEPVIRDSLLQHHKD